MASLVLFKGVLEQIAEKQHDFENDSLKIALSNTAPNIYTNTVIGNISEIAAENGYPAGGLDVTVTYSGIIYGDYILSADNISITSNGGNIGPFRYVVIYNSTNNLLVGYWDCGQSITLRDGDAFIWSLEGLFSEVVKILNSSPTHKIAAVDSLDNYIDPIEYTDDLGDTWRSFTFTTSGTLTCLEDTNIEYLIVGGGGGSSSINYGGSGGGGGGAALSSEITISKSSYIITIGGGGAGISVPGDNGSNSTFGDLVAIGGGGGGGGNSAINSNTAGSIVERGQAGGCGGGAGARNIQLRSLGGVGSVGKSGGRSYRTSQSGRGAGGGGGMAYDGEDADPDPTNGNRVVGGNGGDGLEWPVNAGIYYSGGGGGGVGYGNSLAPLRGGLGGLGGGGNGSNGGLGTNGVINTGGGAGGSGSYGATSVGRNGGSGIVIIRYRI